MNAVRWLAKLVSVLLVALLVYAAASQLPLRYGSALLPPQAGGQNVTGCLSPFYDPDGQQIDLDTYRGPLPVYTISDEGLAHLGIVPDFCTFAPPQAVSPADLNRYGIAHYTLAFEQRLEKGWVRQGESLVLWVRLSVTGTYQPDSPLVTLAPGETRWIEWTLLAPGFLADPDNDHPRPVAFSPAQPAEYSWVLTPTSQAAGDQELVVWASENPQVPGAFFYASPVIRIQVRHLLGLEPLTLAVIAAVSSTLGWLFSAFKDVLDIGEKIRQRRKTTPGASPS